MKTLYHLLAARPMQIANIKRILYQYIYGVYIGRGVRIALNVKFDKFSGGRVYIGDYTLISSRSAILTYDQVNSLAKDVRIGKNCFIGYGAIILPGTTIGDSVIVSENSVVDFSVPSNTIVSGNPSRIVEKDIVTGKWGNRLKNNNILFFDKK